MSERDVSPGGLPFPVKPKMIVIAIIVIGLLALGMSSFYIVDQTEEAVVLRFGKFKSIEGPGLQYKLPFGIERNYNVPTKVVQYEYFGYRTEQPGITTRYSRADYPEESIMLTGDLNIIDVEWSVQYKITDAKAWLFHVENRHKTIRDVSQSVVNQLVGDRTIFDVIGPERNNIMVQAQDNMNRIFKQYQLGINVVAVQLRNIVPPEGVQDAFEDVNKAIQDMERLINEGKEEYNREIPKAKGQAEKVVLEAEGYKSEKINEAKGDVARFLKVYEQYRKNPKVTRERLYIEMFEDVFEDGQGTDIIDKNLTNFLPLKSLNGGVPGGQQ